MKASIFPSDYSLVSVVEDSTETYFIAFDDASRIFRRTAIGLLEKNDNSDDRFPVRHPVYMDEDGKFQIAKDGVGRFRPDAYDSFTVGVPKILGTVRYIENAEALDLILPFIKKLKTEYGITFRKPARKTVELEVYKRHSSFALEWKNADCADDLPFGDGYGIWEKNYEFNDPESLVTIGRWLGFFRYAFDMPELRYNLCFEQTKDYSPEEWKNEKTADGWPSYEEQRRIDSANEALYKADWEQAIHAEADGYYNSLIEKN